MKKVLLAAFVMSVFFTCETKDENQQMAAVKSSEHRCANCGMITSKYPKWEQMIVKAPGDTMFFDGARCMFKIQLDSATAVDSENIQVKDYYTLEYIDGKTAYYVIGSDVLGPMGNELIPFTTEDAAKEFLNDHKAEKIIRFSDVEMAMIMKLAGKMKM